MTAAVVEQLVHDQVVESSVDRMITIPSHTGLNTVQPEVCIACTPPLGEARGMPGLDINSLGSMHVPHPRGTIMEDRHGQINGITKGVTNCI
jgi:hypothetical protein